MLNQLLKIERPLFCIDTETTGTDVQKDRIVELAFQKWEPVSEAARAAGHDGMTKEWSSLINPGVPIQASATKVHGITDAQMKMCRECGRDALNTEHAGDDGHAFKPVPTFKQLAANLAKGFTDCDWMGQNVRFDLRILSAEFARAGVPWSYVGARIIDSYQLERLAVPRSLSHLHEKYVGLKHDGAHGALSDVRAAATVIAKQLETHDALPRDLDKLHEAQWPGYLCDSGQFKMIDGVAICCFGKKWNGRAMKDIDVGYWDWILGQDFPADVKHLAADAKLGKFPEGK